MSAEQSCGSRRAATTFQSMRACVHVCVCVCLVEAKKGGGGTLA